MNEFTLPQSVEPTSATVSHTPQSVTVTVQVEPPDKCALQQEAFRDILIQLKKATKVMQEREEAWFLCKHGISLSSTEPISGPAFSDATTLRGATGAIFIQIEWLALAAGIRVE